MARARTWSSLFAVTIGILSGCATVPHPAPPVPAEPAAPAPAPAPAPDQAAPPPTARGGTLAPEQPPPEPIRELAEVTLGAMGDVLMHEAVKQSAAAHASDAPDAGYYWLFSAIADLISRNDLGFANLETPIAPQSSQGSHAFVFNAPRFVAWVFPIVAGTLIQAFGGISRAAMTLGSVYLLGLVLPWFLPETKGRPLPD